MTIVIGLSVVGLMAFGLALSYYRNILFDEQLIVMKDRNKKLKEEILDDYALLQYYRSEQYKDKYAKENLGLVRPGEKALIITHVPEDAPLLTTSSMEPSLRQEAAYTEILRQMPVLEHWKLFLFHKEKIEEMKRGL